MSRPIILIILYGKKSVHKEFNGFDGIAML